jgi:hypothetical protein
MKKEEKKTQKKGKKTHLKVKKQTVKDLDAEKASQRVKGGQKCNPTLCLPSYCGGSY